MMRSSVRAALLVVAVIAVLPAVASDPDLMTAATTAATVTGVIVGVPAPTPCPSSGAEDRFRRLAAENLRCLDALESVKSSLSLDVYRQLRAIFASNIEDEARRQTLLNESIRPLVDALAVPEGVRFSWRLRGTPAAAEKDNPCALLPGTAGAFDTVTKVVNICTLSQQTYPIVRHELMHAWQFSDTAPGRESQLRGFATFAVPGGRSVTYERVLQWTPSPALNRLAVDLDEHYPGDETAKRSWRVAALAAYCAETQTYLTESLYDAVIASHAVASPLQRSCLPYVTGLPTSPKSRMAALILEGKTEDALSLYEREGLPRMYALYAERYPELRGVARFEPRMCRYTDADFDRDPLFRDEARRIRGARER